MITWKCSSTTPAFQHVDIGMCRLDVWPGKPGTWNASVSNGGDYDLWQIYHAEVTEEEAKQKAVEAYKEIILEEIKAAKAAGVIE